jgi:hypothetical protein
MTCDGLHLLRIGQYDLQRIFRIVFQHVEHGLPVNSRALHHRVGAAFRLQPLARIVEFATDGENLAHLRLRFFVGWSGHNADHQKLLADIDADAPFDYSSNHRVTPSAEACRRLSVYKLFCEPKLIPGCVLRRPNQVHPRGLSPTTTLKSSPAPALTRRSRNQTGKSATMPKWASNC